ncbi:restriction endonuclease [Pararhodobacter zhoushanensis]|uniref:restriction endonuclease n=1 Tax=Pararhodobacter zhoushanensis TaxID=2479545 RepID=UPI000F8D70B1|nr:restriction endonuclease [Pararhodobacter zhoushanensis]
MQGTVVRIRDSGYGFIARSDLRRDIFFHGMELLDVPFDDLCEGDKIEFEVVEGPKGPFAANIRKNDYVTEESTSDEDDADLIASGVRAHVQVALDDLCKKLAHLVAKHPAALDEIEWRDLERLVAEVFEGLGFSVELTQCSGDGGKDVVVKYSDGVRNRTFFVEVKHWRSGKRVGGEVINQFVHTIAREAVDGGVLLSSSGFATKSIENIVEIDKLKIGLGTDHKIACLCRNYVRAKDGLWTAPPQMETVIFEDTISEKR